MKNINAIKKKCTKLEEIIFTIGSALTRNCIFLTRYEYSAIHAEPLPNASEKKFQTKKAGI